MASDRFQIFTLVTIEGSSEAVPVLGGGVVKGCEVVGNNQYQTETFQRVFSWNMEISLKAL